MPKSNDVVQEARWVLRAQLGDTQALERLLESIQGDLLEFLRHRLGSSADAEDCAQGVLMKICKSLGGLREARALRPWMYRIAAREATRRYRRRARELQVEEGVLLEQMGPEPESDEHAELVPRIREQMKQLPPNSSGVLFLHYLEGLSLLEISKVLDRPLGTIKSRLAYGLAKLREQLKETSDE
jgi:RNA polymerase sigma-70 factor (ECF subfamily)